MVIGTSIALFFLAAQQPASDQAASASAPASAPSEKIEEPSQLYLDYLRRAGRSTPIEEPSQPEVATAPKPEPAPVLPSIKSALLLTSLGGGLLGGGLTACLTAGICAGASFWLMGEMASSVSTAPKSPTIDDKTIKYFWPSGALAAVGAAELIAGGVLTVVGTGQAY